jgi:uncharacterized membrane protein YhaH (DUF805 family)
MAFCTNCGTKLDEGAKFCVNCGAKTGEITGMAAQEIPAQTANNYAVPPVVPAQMQQINVSVPPQPYAGQNAPVAGQNKTAWQYFCGVWKKYAVFDGRARRTEFWWFALFNGIISFVLGFIEGFALTGLGIYLYIAENVGLLTVLYGLTVLLPNWGVMVRRFHDVDKRAWWVLVPIYGWIVIPCTAGTVGPNRFGPDPKQAN